MPAAPDATAEHIKDVNTRYHDAAADSYDAKWGIDHGLIGQEQVRVKLAKAIGSIPAEGFDHSLEIGAGTGYFTINMLQQGMTRQGTACDISPGMLEVLSANADRLGVEVETMVCEAEHLPFADQSFDLVFGHAVLHHIPDLQRAFSEFHRVLRPGGIVAFCGEPSAYGDRLAAMPKRFGVAAAPLWRKLVRAPELSTGHPEGEDHVLEAEVDVHAFEPELLREWIREAGFIEPRVKGEELLANMHGWTLRTLESTAQPETIPMAWRQFAFRTYMALQKLDARLLEPYLPPQLFYNLVLSGRKPS